MTHKNPFRAGIGVSSLFFLEKTLFSLQVFSLLSSGPAIFYINLVTTMNHQYFLSAAIIFFLVSSTCSLTWQGMGVMGQSDIAFVEASLQLNFNSFLAPSSTNFSKVMQGVSNDINRVWSPAWNIFVFETFDPSVTPTFYGYAFNGHWMWISGYQFQNRNFSIVIWKNNNCKVWNTVDNSNLQSKFSPCDANSALQQTLSNALAALQDPIGIPYTPYEDIYQHSYLLVKKMEELTPGKTYTIVAIQDGFMDTTDNINTINGHFCSIGGASSYIITTINRMSSTLGVEGLHKIAIIQMS